MQFPLLSCLFALVLACVVEANTEKQVFWAPHDSDAPGLREWRKSLIANGIEVLTPANPSIRRKVHAAFPHSPELSEPNQVWILCDELVEDVRYEVHISFSAMQPSTQNLSVPSLSEVFRDKDQKANLEKYMKTRKSQHKIPPASVPEPSNPKAQSGFFFIGVDPNFFTIDQKMMRDGILVEFDIVLDPYVVNILPRSTLPLSIYITLLACIALPLSGVVWRSLQYVARLPTETRRGSEDQNKDD